MADEGLRFEAFTMPHVGALTRKFDFTKFVESYTLNDRFNDLSDGTLSMPDDFDKKTSLFYVDEANHANDVGSMIRVLRGTTPIMHYLVTRSEDSWSDGEPTHKLSLEGLEWILDRVLVPNYDHPVDPTKEPDWIYGAPSILANTGLEDGGASNLLIHVWLESTVSAGTWTMTFPAQTTSALAFNIDLPALQTAIEALSNIQDILISGAGTEANPWIIEVVDPAGTDFNVSINSGGLTGGSALFLLQHPGGTGVVDPWTRSFNPVTGLFHGTYTNFQTSTAQAHTGTTSLYVKGALGSWPDSFPGAQQIVSVTGGRTYRAKIWVYPAFARTYRFVIRSTDETYIGAVEASLTANSWQEMAFSVTIPDHIQQIIFRIACISNTNGHEFYVDDALLAPGFDADTLGKMVDDVRTAAIAVGSPLSWLTPTWSTTLDSDGAAWDQDRAWNVNHGQTFLQLLEYVRKWNYEWRIRWDAGDARFEWDMWNPLGGGQARANIALTGKSGVTGSAPIVSRPPDRTYWKVEGANGNWGEFASTTLDDVWGRLEGFHQDRQGVDSAELDEYAERKVTTSSRNTSSLMVTVGDPVLLPWTSYEPGDTLTVNLAPKETKQSLRVAAIVVSMGPDQAAPRYDVHFGAPVYSNEAAMAQGLRTVLREFRRPMPTQVDGSVPPFFPLGGSAPTLVIAASNSSDSSKARADFICLGSNDHLTFQTAISQILAGGGGRLLVTEGVFSFSGTVDIPTSSSNLRIEGMGVGSSKIVMAVAANANTFRVATSYSGTLEFASLEINGSSSTQTTGAWAGIFLQTNGTGAIRIDQCWIHNIRGDGINSDRSALLTTITNTRVSSNTLCGMRLYFEGLYVISNCFIHSNTEHGINADAASNMTLVDSWIYENTLDGFFAGGVSQDSGVIIAGNHFVGNRIGIRLEGYDSVIAWNVCAENASYGIWAAAVRAFTVTGNACYENGEHGIYLTNAGSGEPHGGTCSGNVTTHNSKHGIYVDGRRWLVTGNKVESNSLLTNNTYDGIHLTTNGDFCSIVTNMIRQDAGANKMRYGIQIAAGATSNLVAGNDAREGGFVTAAFNDAGTTTVNAWAGAFGDNLP